MSYLVRILRTKGKNQEPISRTEVEKAVGFIPSLKIRQAPNECLEILFMDDDQEAVLMWKDGEILVKNPEREMLQVMLDLATKLNARVRGDELETYRTPEQTFCHPDDFASLEVSWRINRKANRKQWLLNGAIFVGFILLALLVNYFSR
ncbi:MAG TPA: hypothetical protein DDW49_00315 [Deltaproteobacteria bacterium]|nr:MAG: hypothetical protein A2048_00130 [Deltaproteobacteria bacterium GWA2_45_12]HBF11829.1 hypothetical protein [Deltaproteobacteria bacterium]